MNLLKTSKSPQNIDLVVVWPKHVDYPLWRQMIRDTRSNFNKVIIVFTDMKTPGDYREFIRSATIEDKLIIIDNDEVRAEQDWRNVAVHKALSQCESEWVWFTEQDFFPKLGFFETVEEMAKTYNVVGAFSGTRLHPCSIFIKRKLVLKTNQDFSAKPDEGYDHFGVFQEDLIKMDEPIGVIPEAFYLHLNGLSQNMHLAQTGGYPNFRPDDFKRYMNDCLEVNVPIHPDFLDLYHSLYSN